jgi:drug/metabolite transporter (DMT)-like permease
MKLSRGLLYMAASAFGFSAMSTLVKLASARLPIGEIVFARALVTLVLSFVLVRQAGLSPWGNRPLPLMFRGLLGFGGLTSLYIALSRLPLADTTTLQNVTPLLVAVLAWWLLDERIGWSTAIAIGCGLVGVALVVHPSGTGLDPLGVVAALSGVVCSSFAYVTVRKLSRTEHPLVIVLYFPLVATPLALPWMLVSFEMPQPIDWLLLVAIGAATQIGQVFMTLALSIERAGRATTIGYLQVALAMAWQLIVFGEPPGAWTIAGASLIVGSTVVIAQLTGSRPGSLVRAASASGTD